MLYESVAPCASGGMTSPGRRAYVFHVCPGIDAAAAAEVALLRGHPFPTRLVNSAASAGLRAGAAATADHPSWSWNGFRLGAFDATRATGDASAPEFAGDGKLRANVNMAFPRVVHAEEDGLCNYKLVVVSPRSLYFFWYGFHGVVYCRRIS
jgi:hypothetical protein